MDGQALREDFEASRALEADRIGRLARERGEEAARQFARQTLSGYRRAVVSRSAPAGDPAFRLRLIASYCYLKRYLNG